MSLVGRLMHRTILRRGVRRFSGPQLNPLRRWVSSEVTPPPIESSSVVMKVLYGVSIATIGAAYYSVDSELNDHNIALRLKNQFDTTKDDIEQWVKDNNVHAFRGAVFENCYVQVGC